MHINIEAVRTDLVSINEGIRKCKSKMAKRWDYPETPEAQRYLALKLKPLATLIYTLVAHSRSRSHIQGVTLEDQEKYLEHNRVFWSKYLVKQVA